MNSEKRGCDKMIIQTGIRTDMAKTGRPKSENVKKKVLSIRVEDSMYKCICDYARKHKMTVTEVVLQGLEKVLNRPE